MSLDLKDYSYHLPEKLIANKLESKRDHCRLLSLNKKTGKIDHLKFFDLIKTLNSNDVLVLNQSKVFPARLFGQKTTGGKFEILLLHQIDAASWQTISKPRLTIGQKLIFGHSLEGQVMKSNKITGEIEINFNQKHQQFLQTLDKIGHTPLPPYISSKDSESEIRKEYQTVYAKETGSAAAPTAGLHFTKKLLSDLKKRGVQIEYITLHVGLGTFQNLRPENITSKTLHQEFYEIDTDTAKRLNLAKEQGRRIIAVGTTSVRTLESAYENNQLKSGQSSTQIFIYPPYKFKFIDALITNFHLPESSLLMLVSAFAGKKNIFNAYQEAINQEYRFFSFGDAMFIF
ncbi:MAG: tRNA preQ1(34) S-adenosylmethionine ribosyltransferase-isomerase QueA [Candidatus Shapirobacteria bacterium]|nr:tRNA preQ1(34) S-adenosylmethionine ribosyltransferase-isomerase QueA [Candidatus Shapirobacteria bacterium]MDD4410820.1 tRNA preQ1(34) S-adenosylmethionine ribosyltransferase-isomerase QueA [Candidatus Shapirobacteria bacterium]